MREHLHSLLASTLATLATHATGGFFPFRNGKIRQTPMAQMEKDVRSVGFGVS